MTSASRNNVAGSLLIVVGLLAVLVVFLAVVAIRASSSRRGAGIDEERVEMSGAPRATVRRAENERRRTAWPSASEGGPALGTPIGQGSEVDQADTAAPRRGAATKIPPRPTSQQIAHKLDLRIEHEPVDAAWAPRTENALSSEVYAARVEHTSVASVRCASTMCRLTLDHSEAIDRNELVAALSKREPFFPGAYFHRDEQAHQTIVYVVRSGHQLFGGGAEVSAENR